MKLHQLEKASDYEVKKWLEEELKLTPYQKQRLYNEEIIRFSPFHFYKHSNDEKPYSLWRLTVIFYVIYIVILLVAMPFVWITTGKWGYGEKFYDNFHAKWNKKMGFKFA